MNTTNQVLDRLQKELSLPSGYAISKVLGITRTAVYDYRANKRNLSDEVAIKAAKLLKIDPKELLINLHKERAQTDLERDAWDSQQRLIKLQNLLNNQKLKDALNRAANDDPTLKNFVDDVQECILC